MTLSNYHTHVFRLLLPLVIGGGALCGLIWPAETSAAWLHRSYEYRVLLEIVPSKVGTTSAITNFPVYVNLADLPSGFWSNVQSDGDDIRVTQSDGETETPFEVVNINTASSTGELHFLAPSLATTSTSTFYLYFGNPTATGYASTSLYGSRNVWTNGYVSVFHLDEDPSGSSPQFRDSTRAVTGSAQNLEASDRVNGKVGRAIQFDGTNEYITTTVDQTVTTSTWSTWLYATGTQGDWAGIMFSRGNATGITLYGNSDTQLSYTWNNDFNTYIWNSNLHFPLGDWVLVTMVATQANATLYVHSSSSITSANHIYTKPSSRIDALNFARDAEGGGRHFNGLLDYGRLSNVARDAGWLLTEFNNQNDPDTFYATPTLETYVEPSWYDNDFSGRLPLDIVPSKVGGSTGPLTNFPVYVNLADLPSEFWSNVQSDGDDIRVTQSDGETETPLEVVNIDTASSTGELHFLANRLSITSTSTFYLYFANPTATGYASTSPYGSQNVWSGTFYSVHHLSQEATTTQGAFRDATPGGAHATGFSVSSSNTVTGKVGRAVDLDGSNNDYLTAPDSSYDFESTQPFSGSLWINLDTLAPDTQIFVSKLQTTAPYRGWEFYTNTSGALRFRGISTFGVGVQAEVSGGSVSVGSWHHVAWTYNGNGESAGMNVYLNGQRMSTSSISNNLGSNTMLTDVNLGIGRRSTNIDGNPWPLNGRMDSLRISTTTLSTAWFLTEYHNQSTTTQFYAVGEATINIDVGSLTIGEHSAGQAENEFSFNNKTDIPLYAFSLTAATETVSVNTLTFSLAGVNGIDTTKLTSLRLYRDTNNDGAFDGGDVAVMGTGILTITNQTGTIAFSTTMTTGTTSTNYILIGNTVAIKNNDSLRIDLVGIDVDAVGVTSLMSLVVNGSVSELQHARGPILVEFRAPIGGDAPTGAGVRSGGSSGTGIPVGQEIGQVADGANIAPDPDFFRPSNNGSPHNEWTNPGNAYQSDGSYATAGSAGLRQTYGGFGFELPGGNTVQGIIVKVDGSGSTAAGAIEIALSWDGGISTTTTEVTPTLSGSDVVYVVGGQTTTWGRAWTPAELNDTNFRVRVTAQPSSNTVRLDALEVRVYHTATGGGGGGGGEI